MSAATQLQSYSQSALDHGDRLLSRLTTLVRASGDKIALALQVRQERRDLKTLSADQLRDIGIDQHVANREAGRSFLDLPPNRDR